MTGFGAKPSKSSPSPPAFGTGNGSSMLSFNGSSSLPQLPFGVSTGSNAPSSFGSGFAASALISSSTAPASSFAAPVTSFANPTASFASPAASFAAPAASFASPVSSSTAPAFGAAPATSFTAAPSTSFASPAISSFGAAPVNSFGAPAASFASPVSSSTAPAVLSFGTAPAASFTAPAPSFTAPMISQTKDNGFGFNKTTPSTSGFGNATWTNSTLTNDQDGGFRTDGAGFGFGAPSSKVSTVSASFGGTGSQSSFDNSKGGKYTNISLLAQSDGPGKPVIGGNKSSFGNNANTSFSANEGNNDFINTNSGNFSGFGASRNASLMGNKIDTNNSILGNSLTNSTETSMFATSSIKENGLKTDTSSSFGGNVGTYGTGNFPNNSKDNDAVEKELEKKNIKLAKFKDKIDILKQRKKELLDKKNKDEKPKLSPFSPPFNPSVIDSLKKTNDVTDPIITLERKEINASRFTTKKDRKTIKLLPEDVQRRVESNNFQSLTPSHVNNDITKDDADEDCVGTCPHMCPEQELITRESEGEIPLLEITHEQIHPKSWNLRQTAVKRFYRSSADYKLNIPDQVRPPHVLERVCSYLEEWVMERDRQGTDPRFDKNGQSQVPNSLDVYQYIWDRTRMVRKDFILQNFIGTGGRCNACAVRCHERIARWHAMSEHQLSHLSDFVKNQSQQNVTELGQTMKTLNFFYDDAEGRSALDEDNTSGEGSLPHGCTTDTIQGECPVDYDGQPLVKTLTPSGKNNRIIGSTLGGTAEPEMRGLYILLTMDNDGGMEVLKFVTSLSMKRPMVFNSQPVQLALKVYKAKNERNYALFFSILRSSSTPYLFACIMFKHVMVMRKIALYTMSKTFGIKQKDKENNIHIKSDEYPLSDLIRLLCFEDVKEALNTCQHYNITVKKIVKGDVAGQLLNEMQYVVLWRHSSFGNRNDKEKKTKTILTVKKMVRTIESKLAGATRLAICRGDVSGPGATLSKPLTGETNLKIVSSPLIQNETTTFQDRVNKKTQEIQNNSENKSVVDATLAKEKKLISEVKKQLDEKRENLRRQQRQANDELIKKQIKEKYEKEEKEKKLAKKKEEKEEKLRKEILKKKKREGEEEKERQRSMDLERERKALVKKKEIEFQEALAKKKLKELNRRKEFERKQHQIETRKLQHLKEKQMKKENEKIKKIAEESREIEFQWQTKMKFSRKLLSLKKWSNFLHHRRICTYSTKNSLDQFDNIQTQVMLSIPPRKFSIQNDRTKLQTNKQDSRNRTRTKQQIYGKLFYKIGTDISRQINLAEIIASYIDRQNSISQLIKEVVLVKFAVIVIENENGNGNVHEQDLSSLVLMWLNSRLKFGLVSSHFEERCEIRAVAVKYSSSLQLGNDVDAALVIIPPGADRNILKVKSSITASLQRKHPLAFLSINNCDDEHCMTQSVNITNGLDDKKNETYIDVNFLETQSLDYFLQLSFEILIKQFTSMYSNIRKVEKMSVHTLSSLVLRKALFCHVETEPNKMNQKDNEKMLLEVCRRCLQILIRNLKVKGKNMQGDCYVDWPASEFLCSSNKHVMNYFPGDEGLPSDWLHRFSETSVEVRGLMQYPFLNKSITIANALADILACAHPKIRQQCGFMLQQKQLRSALDKALLWREKSELDSLFFFFPYGEISSFIESVVSEVFISQAQYKRKMMDIPLLVDFDMEKDSVVLPCNNQTILNKSSKTEEVILLESEEGKKRKKYNILKKDVFQKRLKSNKEIQVASIDVSQSQHFTARLESLLKGQTCIGFQIGSSNLNDILNDKKLDESKLPTDFLLSSHL